MNSPVSNPENYCPICGVRFGSSEFGQYEHRCTTSKLNALDAARARDYTQVRTPHKDERLKDGFAMLSDDEVYRDEDEPDPDRLIS